MGKRWLSSCPVTKFAQWECNGEMGQSEALSTSDMRRRRDSILANRPTYARFAPLLCKVPVSKAQHRWVDDVARLTAAYH
jgi:hypothetical protein